MGLCVRNCSDEDLMTCALPTAWQTSPSFRKHGATSLQEIETGISRSIWTTRIDSFLVLPTILFRVSQTGAWTGAR